MFKEYLFLRYLQILHSAYKTSRFVLIKRRGLQILLFSLTIWTHVYAGNVYYVDATRGDDQNSGLSESSAWKTIDKANKALIAGDTVYIRGGTYRENNQGSVILPENSGSPGNYITYKNYNGEQVFLTGVFQPIAVAAEYIKIDGIIVDGDLTTPNVTNVCCRIMADHFIVQNCTFKNPLKTSDFGAPGIYAADRSYGQILNNTISDCGWSRQMGAPWEVGDGIKLDKQGGAGTGCKYILIQGNDVRRCYHSLIETWGEYIIVRNNTCVGNGNDADSGGRLLNAKSINYAQYWRQLYENNVVYDCRFNAGWPASSIILINRGCIFRKNICHTGRGLGVEVCGDSNYTASNSRVYNNTVYGFGTTGFSPEIYGLTIHEYVDGTLNDVVLRNNIVYKNYADGVHFREYAKPADHIVNRNHFTANGNPMFVNEANYDFHLQPSSPCIDRGAFLTKAKSTGSGTQLQVDDAGYFIDGFGIVEGDLIQLKGQTQTARITNINYTSNLITVDKSLTWYTGQGVSLAYSGSAPDLGALEYHGRMVRNVKRKFTDKRHDF